MKQLSVMKSLIKKSNLKAITSKFYSNLHQSKSFSNVCKVDNPYTQEVR